MKFTLHMIYGWQTNAILNRPKRKNKPENRRHFSSHIRRQRILPFLVSWYMLPGWCTSNFLTHATPVTMVGPKAKRKRKLKLKLTLKLKPKPKPKPKPKAKAKAKAKAKVKEPSHGRGAAIFSELLI